MSKYYKEEDLQRALSGFVRETGIDEKPFDYAVRVLDSLPTIEVSEDCISRQQAIDAVIEWYGCKPDDIEAFEEELYKAPSVIPQPKEGEWVNKQEKYQMAECSNCKKVTMHEMWGDKLVYYDYCPNCGAKMKGADDE